ncbi:MAG: hypothetical protein AB4372_38670, partial [Xenococcus sp. (in: cyanobacteria)]
MLGYNLYFYERRLLTISMSKYQDFFQEAEKEWDLKKIYDDLEKIKQKISGNNKRKNLTDLEKCDLRGLLLRQSPKKIANALDVKEVTVRIRLSRGPVSY